MNQGRLLFAGIRKVLSRTAVPPYFIACTKAAGELDWDLMQHLLADSNRAKTKVDAVRELSDMKALPVPRLWSPQYDLETAIIVYSPSGQL
jgi:hypothetical protein